MKISVIATVLNEEFFLPLWFSCVSKFANEIILTDGGSTDNTIDIISKYMDNTSSVETNLSLKPQIGEPYTEDWHQGEYLNDLLDRCTGEYVVLLDIDEYVERSDVLYAVHYLKKTERTLANFVHVPFWGDLHHIRLSTEEDPRWFGNSIARVIKHGDWKYMSVDHHSAPEHVTFCRTSTAWKEETLETSCRLFNLHYGFGAKGIKKNDNRKEDLGDEGFIPTVNEPNFDKTSGKFGYILTRPYGGPWPEDLHQFLEDAVNE